MSEPSLDKYEQLLANDPASPVFVDWAKALIERQDYTRAVAVITRGLSYHADSIVGYVLLGRCHLQLARASEAMSAFDAALGIEPENPYAYNLVSEALLEKKMYRPALPLLKKAVALQPNDGKLRQWLAEAQKALDAAGLAAPQADPFDAVAQNADSPSVGESTVIFNPNAPQKGEQAAPESEPDPFQVVVATSPRKDAVSPEPQEMTQAFDTLAQRQAEEQTVIPSAALMKEALANAVPPSRPHLAQIPPPSGRIAASVSGQGKVESLLPDVPALRDTNPGLKTGLHPLTTQETEAVAREYELELRRQMAEQTARGSFLQRHGTRILLSVMAILIGMAFAVAYLQTQAQNSGRDLADHLAEARKAFARDTASGYREGLQSLATALKMAPDNTQSMVWSAYGYAALYAEHGGLEDDRKSALFFGAQSGVREANPGLSLVTSYWLANTNQKAKLKRDVIASTFDQSEVEELAGRLLLADRQTDEAWKRLSRAVELNPGNVRALIALGNYYLAFSDPENALKVLDGTAAQLSREHPERVLGAAEARLMLRRELDESLEEVKNMQRADVPGLQAGRRQRLLGQLYSATGKHAEALETLQEGIRLFEGQAFEFELALGKAAIAAGRMATAQKALEAAHERQRTHDEALDLLGRVLLARDREQEVLQMPGESRTLHLLRGLAHAQLKDWKKARIELYKTQVQGKYPPEAVVQLALADGFEGNDEKAIEVLEKVRTTAKTAKDDVNLAIGLLQWKRGQLPNAKESLELAAKEPTNYEGACSMGRLLLELNLPELAVTPLLLSVSRNDSHRESHAALQRALDTLGRYPEALMPARQWAEAHPGSWEAQWALARALYLNGKFEEADTATAAAVKLGPSVVSAWRLRASALFARGDIDKAVAALEKANQLGPKDIGTLCDIGLAYMRSAEKENAQAAFNEALKLDAKSHCGNVGVYLAKLPAVGPSAARELLEWSKSAPDGTSKAFAETVRARALLANGALKEARVAAEAAVKLTPYSGQAQWALAQVAVKQKDDEVAFTAFEKAVEYEPVSAAILLAFGDTYSRGKNLIRVARAVAAYEAFLKLGGAENDVKRVERELPQLKKRLE